MSAAARISGSNEARAARDAARVGFGFVFPATAWVALFFIAPLALMAWLSLKPLDATGQPGAVGLGNYMAFFGQSASVQALWNSIVTTALVVVISVGLAYPFAYAIAFVVPKRWQRLALAMAVLPFWTSYVVRSYAWLLALSPSGVINWTLRSLGLTSQPILLAYNPGATVLGFVHFFIMLNTLTIYANLVQINPRYRMAAEDLGAGSARSFLTVVLPLSRPGVAVGAFLTVVLCIGDYVTPQILGGFKQLLLPQLIMMQLQRQLDLPMASALSLIMTVVVAILYLALQPWLRMPRL